jgi:DNA invertase Pin-like site-specific DNA recombinase
MRTAIYTRVSTEKQSHDSQLTELRDYCRRRDWKDLVEYRDVISGARWLAMTAIHRQVESDTLTLWAPASRNISLVYRAGRN